MRNKMAWSNVPRNPCPTFLVASVCGRWGDAALTWPCAWTTIVIREFYPFQGEKKCQSTIHALRILLERSGNSLLHIHIDLNEMPLVSENKQLLDT